MDVPRVASRRQPAAFVAVALAALVGVSVAVSRLSQAPPSVPLSTVWVDTVRRGELLREVSAPGTLVPDDIRWVTAETDGLVERIHVSPGSPVEADTVLLELSNPDLELSLIDARRDMSRAEADLEGLRATLEMERLAQESQATGIEMQFREAQRQAEAAERLAHEALLPELEHARTRDRADELQAQLRFERGRLRALEASIAARVKAQQAQIERPKALAELRQRQVHALRVRAGRAGVLQALPLEVGQRVSPGTLLAKVIEPSRLKVELRVPEAQARQVALDQPVHLEIAGSEVKGRVVRIDPAVESGTVTIDVAVEGPLPTGARADLSVDGRIEIARLADVLHTGRPAFGGSDRRISLFRLRGDGASAERVSVRLGGASVTEVEIVEGLELGDRVILSDMSDWDNVDELSLD